RNAPGHVFRVAMGLDLAGKNVIVGTVVRPSRQHRLIRGESQGGKPTPRFQKTANQLAANMLRVRRRPSVAEYQEFVTGLEGRGEQVGGSLDGDHVVAAGNLIEADSDLSQERAEADCLGARCVHDGFPIASSHRLMW